MRSSVRATIGVALLLAVVGGAHAANWAFLVSAGDEDTSLTNTMEASVCRLYHILVKNGVDPNHIILMMSDYFATAKENPTPGQLYDMPNGQELYAGCVKDYVGKDVNIDIYTAVLTGDAATTKGHGTGKVLNVTKSDNVYVYYNDHGGPGENYFPGWEPFSVDQNKAVIDKLTKKAGKVYFTIMACESGSMFEFVNETYTNLVAESSSDYDSDSMASFCDEEPIGNSTYDGCLSSEFESGLVVDYLTNPYNESVHAQYAHVDLWMEADQAASLNEITPPVIFGSPAVYKMAVSSFFGKKPASMQGRHSRFSAPTTPQVWVAAPAAGSTSSNLHCAVADLRAALRQAKHAEAVEHASAVQEAGKTLLAELSAHVSRSAESAVCGAAPILSTVPTREVDLLTAYARYAHSAQPRQELADALSEQVSAHMRAAELFGALATKLNVPLTSDAAARKATNWECVRNAIREIRTCDDLDMSKATRYTGALVNACVSLDQSAVLEAIQSQC